MYRRSKVKDGNMQVPSGGQQGSARVSTNTHVHRPTCLHHELLAKLHDTTGGDLLALWTVTVSHRWQDPIYSTSLLLADLEKESICFPATTHIIAKILNISLSALV